MSKKINVPDVKVKDVVINMAEQFGLEYEKNQNEYCVRIPDTLGSGYVKATDFENGIGVIETDYLLKEPFHIKLDDGVIHPLKLIFNRNSAIQHNFNGDLEIYSIKRLENAILSSSPNNVHEFIIPANVPVCIFSIEINRKEFEKNIEDYLQDMPEDLITIFRDVNGINQFYYKAQYSLGISRLIKEFTECEYEGFMRSVFLKSKAQEILVLQLQQYIDDLNEPDKRKILRQATIESVREASEIIEQEIASVESVSKLASRVGLSANTLQQGFQVLYKSSVNDYIRDFKIEKAKELIETTGLNITEITYQVGINSRSYFSKLFKKRFGISPKKYYSKVHTKSNDDDSKSA